MAKQENQKVRSTYLVCALCPWGSSTCSDSCRNAGSDDVRSACQCDHVECPLMMGSSRRRIVADLTN